MDSNQKLDTLLQTALLATPEELEKSPELSADGALTDYWEVIVRYTGTLSSIRESFPLVTYTELLNNYAILNIPKSQIPDVANLPQITYMEKPKRLFFETAEEKRVSCITGLQTNSSRFSGRDVLVGIIDSGIDYSHPDFRNANGSSRIQYLWDQSVFPDETLGYSPPEGYYLGTLFTGEQIQAALSATGYEERQRLCPSIDLSGHGTHVAGIAAGNGRASNGLYRGVAYDAPLIIVKLAPSTPNGFPSTTQLMQAVDFCIKKSIQKNMPLALNISFGNTYGSHSGTSLIETYLDAASQLGKCCIVVGSGNEGADGGHTGGTVSPQNEPQRIEFAVSDYTPSLTIQLWKNYVDDFRISITPPSSARSINVGETSGIQRYRTGNTNLLIYYGQPAPYSIYQEIYIEFLPVKNYIDAGIWDIRIIPQNIMDGTWNMWMPSAAARNLATRFLLPTPDTTLTIPSTASSVITVGAYDSNTDALAAFSGRGYTWNTRQIKPDLVAPGVNITSCATGGGYTQKSGTSMATPFVTGSTACLMQWGIAEGNDPYLYGEKVKAYLRKGARKLPAFSQYPNAQIGWGALCLKNSLP